MGHYLFALLLKGLDPSFSLGLLFLSVEAADIIYGLFIILGIEGVDVNVKPFAWDLPYSHSLLSTTLFGGLLLAFPLLLRSSMNRYFPAAMAFSLGAFSHWLADLLTHAPDMKLVWWSEMSYGLRTSLFHDDHLAIALTEVFFLFLTYVFLILSLKRSGHPPTIGIYSILPLFLLIQYVNKAFPPNHTPRSFAISMIILFTAITVYGYVIDPKKRYDSKMKKG